MRASELFALQPDAVGVDRWLFDGEMVERWDGAGFHTPAHAAAVANVSRILSAWCRTTSEYRAFGYGCPYFLDRDPDTVLTFDASLVKRDLCNALRFDSTHIGGVPLLAVEVVELDEDADLLTRLVETSLHKGVRTVWVVDPHEEIVVVHKRNGRVTYLNGPMPVEDLPGFRCPVAEIFE